MSRIGKQPIPIPAGVEVKIDGSLVSVKGSKGKLERRVHPEMMLAIEDGEILVRRPSDEQSHRALHGLTRSLVANMVTGVSEGYSKTMLIEGTGYRAETEGDALVLNVGYSHTVSFDAQKDISYLVEDRGKKLTVSGIDKELVGQVAVNIRSVRKPEPYKGKGIRYEDEKIRRKAGKAGKVGK
jgi:large subunit ribosomal protein L6